MFNNGSTNTKYRNDEYISSIIHLVIILIFDKTRNLC